MRRRSTLLRPHEEFLMEGVMVYFPPCMRLPLLAKKGETLYTFINTTYCLVLCDSTSRGLAQLAKIHQRY